MVFNFFIQALNFGVGYLFSYSLREKHDRNGDRFVVLKVLSKDVYLGMHFSAQKASPPL